MAKYNFVAPSLPLAAPEYDRMQQDQLLYAIRLYFNRLDTYNISQNLRPTVNLETLPTEADLADLQVGDVYRDTTADNALKVKV
jgi:hypothetical protein